MTTGIWKHKDEWKREGRNFVVVVSRHSEAVMYEGSGYDAEGPNRWCVYGYVYPKHPDFTSFDPNAPMYEQPTPPMHGGCSFFKPHYKADGTIASFQFGCDYHHLGDWSFTQMETKEDAYEVFADAEALFEQLKARDVQ
jgi:hypothetical protein